MAEYLREKFQPKSVLVISNPFAETAGRPREVYDFQEAALEGLEKGFGRNTTLSKAPAALSPAAKADPSAVPIDPRSKTPLSFLIEENAFDVLVKQHPDASLVVSLIGLPVNLAKCQAWQQTGIPAFALLLPDWRMIGDASAIQHAFDSGKLAAAVVEQGGGAAEEETSGRYRELFQKRFILVTRENVVELLKEQPKIFAP